MAGIVPIDGQDPVMSVGTPAVRLSGRGSPIARLGGIARVPAVRAVGAIVVLGLVLRFWRIGHQGFWFDEANTAADIHYAPGHMLGLLPQNETTPPLFYCVAWVWARIFGFGEGVLRALPALAGVAVIPVAYLAGTRLVSRRAGVIVAALAACNPLLVWYSQEFRPYEPMVLLSACSLLAFACALEEPSQRAVGAWALASALALADHYYAFVLVVPEAIWLLAVHRRRRAVQIGFAVVALTGCALLPLAIAQNRTGNASWIAPIPLNLRLGQIIPQFVAGFQMPAGAVLVHLAEAIAAVGLVLALVRPGVRERPGALMAGALALAGLVLNLLVVAAGADDLLTRNLLALWLPAAITVAAGLATLPTALAGAATAALCAIGITGVVATGLDRGYEKPRWQAVAHLLGAAPPPSQPRVILIQHYKDLLPLSLYERGLQFWRRNVPVRTDQLDVVSFTAPRVPLCWWGAACNLSGSTMQASYPLGAMRPRWRRSDLQFTVLKMTAARPVTLTHSEVAAALTATGLRHDELLIQR